MIFNLRILPELEEDVIHGYSWYESKSEGLGEEFLRIFYACLLDISRNPFLHPKVHGEFRRRLLRRFPYAIYFRVSKDEVVVFGFFHCARNPGSIMKQLTDRD